MGAIIAILSLFFIMGLIVGSFLNVVILRTISGESIVFPPSKCPKCQNKLKWYHNIPLLSYIFLKGKCAYCNEKISIQYPLVEFLTGMVFLGISVFYLHSSIEWGFLDGFDFHTVSFWLFTLIVSCLYIVISGTDIKSLIVYELHTYILMGIGLVFGLIQSIHTGSYFILLYSLAGGVIFFLFMEILKRVLKFFLKTDAIGDGDPFIAGGIGTVLGAVLPQGTDFSILLLALVSVFLLAPLLYGVWMIPVYLISLHKQKNYYLMTGMILFFLYVFTYLFTIQVGWLRNNYAQIISFGIAVILGLWVCFELLKSIREKKSSEFGQIPLGPALVTAALIVMIAIPIAEKSLM